MDTKNPLIKTDTSVDPDRVAIINVPRLVHATGWDAMSWLAADHRPPCLRKIGKTLPTKNVDLEFIGHQTGEPKRQH